MSENDHLAAIRDHADALAAQLEAERARAARLHRYAAMLDARSWRTSRGPLGPDWATEDQARERERYGVADEFDFIEDLDPSDLPDANGGG